MFYIGYSLYGYSKKEYGNTKYRVPWAKKLNSILKYIDNLSNKHPFIKKLCIEKLLCKISTLLERLWIKKNHLVEYSDKEIYRLLSPSIHNNITKLCEQDLICYIRLLEKYGKKELDTWGFEVKPPKKVGKLKRLWYDLTLTVH